MKSADNLFDKHRSRHSNGRLKGPFYVQFVMGMKNSMPADERILDFYIETLNRLTPDAHWCAAYIGPSQYKNE
jgi:3-keto-5-aminohexanoate cleavage enzyme